MDNMPPLDRLSDSELLAHVEHVAQHECEATAALIAVLGELDARRLYLAEGCPSLFAYCTGRLHLSEDAAYYRIQAARTARAFPLVLERLKAGSLTLTAARLLGPHLTPTTCQEVLDAVRYQSKRTIEELVARLHARPDVPTRVRKLPEPTGDSAAPRSDPVTCARAPADALALHPRRRPPRGLGA